ncbi:MAG: tRNA dihydrouridine synthase DusB, partial [Candidatus Omnitrophica bacterium]|nr:tRNA dihydrouridine synthase DusB [Candidatus Omnitrophota bacterium]
MNKKSKYNAIDEIINAKAVLAPMAGVTDMPFRMIARKFGCKFAFTEMIDVNGIIYNNKKTFKLMDRCPEDSPLGVQIVGQDIEKLIKVAKICEENGFNVLDINAGCPARKVVTAGKGSALMKDPAKLGKIIRAVVKKVTIPVTVKIRSGWSDENLNYLEIGRIIESEGAKALAIHSRTKSQMYKGKPDHEVVLKLKENLKIPVFASGNIFSAESARKVLEYTACDAVFVARGALGRPWIFAEIENDLTGKSKPCSMSFDDVKNVIIEHFSLSLSYYGNFITFKRMYKHLAWYLKGYKNLNEIMKEYRLKVNDLESFTTFIQGQQLTLIK